MATWNVQVARPGGRNGDIVTVEADDEAGALTAAVAQAIADSGIDGETAADFIAQNAQQV